MNDLLTKLHRLLGDAGDFPELSTWRPTKGPFPSLSDTEALILQALVVGGEQYGLELVKASKGALKRGTIYVTLSRMEEKGFVESSSTHSLGGDGRRRYRATGLGERAFEAKVLSDGAFQWAFGGGV